MNRKTHLALAAGALVLGLAACSSGGAAPEGPETAEPTSEAPTPDPTVEEPETVALSGSWVAESYSGAVMTVEWGVAPTDERVAELEDFRVASGAEEVSYTLVDVDNRAGTEYQNLIPSQIFDEAGSATDLVDAAAATEDWAPETIWTEDEDGYYSVDATGEGISEEDAVALNEQWASLDLPSGAEPGERVTVVLVGPADLPDRAAGVLLRDASAYPKAN